MEIRHLKLVKTVAEEGSLTNAGKRLFLSQSALSHQLRELEDKFGTSLFQRINKRMVLTQAGSRILKTAESILSELDRTEQDLKQFVTGESGLIRLSTECYTCYHWLPHLLKSFHRPYPNVEVRIVAEATRQPQQFLREGKLDVAIVSCLSKRSHSTDFRFSELFTDELVVVVNSEHHLAAQKHIRPEDFAEENLICYTAPIEVLDIFQRVLIPSGITPKKTTKIQLTEAIVEMIKANLGISAMASWAIKPYLKSKRLVTIPVAQHALHRTWYAVTLNKAPQLRYIDCFIQHLIDHPIS